MQSSLQKIIFALTALCTHPFQSLSWVRRGRALTDRTIIDASYWFLGSLERIPLDTLFPEVRTADVTIPRAFDRTFGTSITVTEAVSIAAIARVVKPKKLLEIGTFDGNTTLLFAQNTNDTCDVVTVDLPPDYDPKNPEAERYKKEGINNMTPRNLVASQYQHYSEIKKIRQVYGDSTKLDWGSFGGPFDLIFIDGCHKEVYVESDTEKALAVLAPNGVLLWHDYGVIPDVTRVVDRFKEKHPEMKVALIEGTRVAVAVRLK